jgi:hypothetical protein
MHRLGLILGAIAAFLFFVGVMVAGGPNQPHPLPLVGRLLVVSLVIGVIVWLVFLGLGWALQGFWPPD